MVINPPFTVYYRCGYEFCYTCGKEWKDKKATCSCPFWDEGYIWNDDSEEEDDDFFDEDDDNNEDSDYFDDDDFLHNFNGGGDRYYYRHYDPENFPL